MVLDERRLLIGRQLHHAKLIIVVQRGEDPLVDAEIRMPHVRAFDRAVERQCDLAEPLRGYSRHSADSATTLLRPVMSSRSCEAC